MKRMVRKFTTQPLHKGMIRSFVVVLIIALTSCSKDSETPAPNLPDTDTPSVSPNSMYYKVIRIENFVGDTSSGSPTATRQTLFYSLEDSTAKDEKFAKTNRWDLSFSGLYNSNIGCNNGAASQNPGYGSSGKGGIYILDKKFEDVVDVPSDDLIQAGNSYMTDGSGAFGLGLGWYCYDWGGTIYGDGSVQKQHVAYALSNRTLIVRTAKGNYAKIKMISIYKNAYTYDLMFKDSPKPYFTFEYVMVPAGSKKFEVKN